jgi:hypothetical protein
MFNPLTKRLVSMRQQHNKIAVCSVPTKMVPFLGNRFSRTAPGVDSGGPFSRHCTFRHNVQWEIPIDGSNLDRSEVLTDVLIGSR